MSELAAREGILMKLLAQCLHPSDSIVLEGTPPTHLQEEPAEQEDFYTAMYDFETRDEWRALEVSNNEVESESLPLARPPMADSETLLTRPASPSRATAESPR